MTEKNAAQPADQEIEAIMEQAQVFASAWAFLGGPFDNGSGLEQAEREKSNLRALLSQLRAPVADERAAFEAAWRELNAPWPMNSRMHDDGRYATPDIEREWRLWQARAALASVPVSGEANAALNEWFDKTDFIQKRIASGELPVKYLGWHRADVMRDLIDAATQNQMIPSGCILVQEADTIPHTHPEYGPGIFFTEDARIEFDAAPQASEAVRVALKTCGSKVFKALAAIARAEGPDTRKADDPELIYREPVMDEAVRIRQAYDELSAALAAQPAAQADGAQ